MGESGPDQSDSTAVVAAEELSGGACAMFLKHPVSDAVLVPVSSYAYRPVFLKNLHTLVDLLNYDLLGFLECFLVFSPGSDECGEVGVFWMQWNGMISVPSVEHRLLHLPGCVSSLVVRGLGVMSLSSSMGVQWLESIPRLDSPFDFPTIIILWHQVSRVPMGTFFVTLRRTSRSRCSFTLLSQCTGTEAAFWAMTGVASGSMLSLRGGLVRPSWGVVGGSKY